MADLKSGTTIGGNTVFTQGNLPIIPAGNMVTYRGWRIYTEADKPNNSDVGLGNVTNDAQVKKSGDTVNGNLGVDKELSVGYRLNLIRKEAGFSPYVVSARSDTIPKADGSNIPSSDRENFTLHTKLTSSDGNPLNGASLASYGVYEKGSSGGGLVRLRANQASSIAADGTLKQGAVGAEIIFDADGNSVTVSTGSFNASAANFSSLTNSGTSTFNGVARFTSSDGINLTAKDSGIDIGSQTETGAAYVDFHTTGKSVDYDYRLVANWKGFSLETGSNIATYDLSLSTVRDIVMNPTAPTGIKGYGGNYFIRDHANGNTSISASLKTDGTAGDLFLGYNSGGIYNTGTVRLEAPMTYKGTTPLVNSSGKLVSTSLDGGSVTASNVTASTLSVSGNSYTTGRVYMGSDAYIRNEAGANKVLWFTDNDGNEEGVIYIDSSGGLSTRNKNNYQRHVTANMVLEANSWPSKYGTGYVQQWNTIAPFQVNFGSVNGGSSYYPIVRGVSSANGYGYITRVELGMLRSGNGAWGKGHIIVGASESSQTDNYAAYTFDIDGNFSAPGQVTASGNLVSGGVVMAGTELQNRGGARVAADGNLYGSRWGAGSASDWIANWITNNFAARNNTGQDITLRNGSFNDVYIRSDRELKRNFVKIENATDKVDKLTGYIYEKRNSLDSLEYDKIEAGIIAQELEAILPEAVTEVNGVKHVAPGSIIALLVNAVNELTARVRELQPK